MANPAFVQGGKVTGSSSPLSMPLTGVTVGDVIAIVVKWNNSTFPITLVSDNQSNVWTTATSQNSISNVGMQIFVGVMAAAPGGNVTVSISWGGGFPGGIVALWEEISGINTTTPVQPSSGVNGATGSSVTTLDSGAVTPSANETWAVGGGFCTANTLTASGTLTEREEDASVNTRVMLSDALIAVGGSALHATFAISSTGGNGIAQIALLQPPAAPATNISHNVDADIMADITKSHNADCYIAVPGNLVHSADADVGPKDPGHSADVWVNPVITKSYILLAGNIIFPILPGNYVKFNSTIATPELSFVNLAGTIRVKEIDTFLDLRGTIQSGSRGYVKLAGTIQNPTYRNHNADCVVSVPNLSFVQITATMVSQLNVGPCGSFPDSSYVNLRGWIVAPGDSIQMPGSGFSRAEDFLSSQVALAAYKPMSVFILNGIGLIVTAYTTGVVSWQTRTRAWLTRLDAAPGGILLTTSTNVHTLPNGAVITTITQVRQQQNTVVTITTIQNSATPLRTSTIITEKNKFGQTTTREIETTNINGIVTQVESKNVYSTPPTTENIQPLKVTTLDGVQHYQFFSQENTEWAGGDAEGTTNTTSTSQIIPGVLNGKSVDVFGNPILAKVSSQLVQLPTGETIDTKTTLIGTTDAGTTTTDEVDQFNGIQSTVHKVVTTPNGAQTVTDITTNLVTGDSTEVDVETVTDEYGQVTITTTNIETKTFTDPVSGQLRTQITKTVQVNKGGVTLVDSSVATTDNYENDIVNQKIQVIFIQEFTLNVVLDEFSMFALWEINQNHQKQYALLELFGQQLGNTNLDYFLRQNLIDQFNAANSCTKPVVLQANGRTYNVVFAPSASAFRAKYIPGTEPHVYELQMILQERSNLVNGTAAFF